MSNQELIRIANEWFSAFNNHDLDRLLSLYHDDAEHYSPKLKVRRQETSGLIKGKTELRAWWLDSFDRIPSLKYIVINLMPFENKIFMEYIRKADGDEDLRVGETLEVKDGQIIFSRVYHS